MDVQPIEKVVWDEKYRFKHQDGTSPESTKQDSMARMCEGVYAKDTTAAKDLGLKSVIGEEWCPAGRIHAGAGTGRSVTLINCFVSSTIMDSMRGDGHGGLGIMDVLAEAAFTQQQGGGIGMDFSPLRPKGALVKNTGSVSDGPLKFMDMWDAMCRTIMSSGSRRGAMMATMDCDHPDIVEFIEAKAEEGRLTNFNLSVLVSDAFMEAVEKDRDWYLVSNVPRADGGHHETFEGKYIYESLRARDLWNKILKQTYVHAEPGIIFIDRINDRNNLKYIETIRATNPCGEQPLPPRGACDLGAVNLARHVTDPFTDKARIDYVVLERTVRVGVRFLDNVLDVSNYPTNEQAEEASNKRRLGLGVTGLANMLQFLRLPYGSHEAREVVSEMMRFIKGVAYDESANLAEQRGCFPLYVQDEFMASPNVETLDETVKAKIRQNGIRNGVLLTIAPTGTTSIYYGNVSSGIEPTFSWTYSRKMKMPDDSFTEFDVEDYGYRVFRENFGDFAELPDYMVTATELSVEDHVLMQAVCQEHIDASISKTVNCPTEMTFEEFQNVYTMAWDSGLKGCTTYRPDPNSYRGSVLEVKSDQLTSPSKMVRPLVLDGKTYKIRWPGIDAPYYVTFNYYVDDRGLKQPFEMFMNGKSVQDQEWHAVTTRLVSAVLRKGGDVSFLVSELQKVHSVKGGQYVNKEFVPSFPAMLGKVMEQFLTEIGHIPGKIEETKPVTLETELAAALAVDNGEMDWPMCPQCEMFTFVKREGCDMCTNCGYSSCG